MELGFVYEADRPLAALVSSATQARSARDLERIPSRWSPRCCTSVNVNVGRVIAGHLPMALKLFF